MPAGDIQSMFSVRQNAWHDPQGRFTRDRYPRSIAEARQWAGHDWEPVEAQGFERIKVDDSASFAHGGQDVVVELADGRYIFRPIAGEKRILRSDTGAHLRTVADSYEVIGNGVMWEVIEAVRRAERQVRDGWRHRRRPAGVGAGPPGRALVPTGRPEPDLPLRRVPEPARRPGIGQDSQHHLPRGLRQHLRGGRR